MPWDDVLVNTVEIIYNILVAECLDIRDKVSDAIGHPYIVAGIAIVYKCPS